MFNKETASEAGRKSKRGRATHTILTERLRPMVVRDGLLKNAELFRRMPRELAEKVIRKILEI